MLDKDQPFVKMPAAKQIALLESLDSGEGEGHQFFRMAKSMTSRLYYQTEVGFKELNKHGIPKTYSPAPPDSDRRSSASIGGQ